MEPLEGLLKDINVFNEILGLQEDNLDKQLSLRSRKTIYDELQAVNSETNQYKKARIKTKKSTNISKIRRSLKYRLLVLFYN